MQSQRLGIPSLTKPSRHRKFCLMTPPKPPQNNTAKNTSVTRYSFSKELVLAIKKLEFWLLPGHCVLCRLTTNRPIDLCIYCERDLPWLFQQCTRCGLPSHKTPQSQRPKNTHQFSVTDTKLFSGISNKNHATHTKLCTRCKTGAHFKQISRTFTPLSYDGCARWMVQQQKHNKGTVFGRVLAELLSDALLNQAALSADQNWPDLLIPVPLYWRREWRRGHNQSAVLAKHLGRRLALPVSEALVKRCKPTPSQQALVAHARTTNVANAFTATPQARDALAQLPNRRVAIIDDVVTTGSTASALAAVLVRAGAEEIHLWSPTRAILKA